MAKRKRKGAPLRNPKFTPTNQMREAVEAMAAYGMPQDVIARLTPHPKTGKPISESALQRYFGHELAIGVWKLVGKTAQSLAGLAHGTPNIYDAQGRLLHPARAPDGPACMFLLKARGGYVDRVAHQLTGKDGSPASIVIALVPAEAKL